MSVIIPKDEMVKLMEALSQAGYEIEMFNASNDMDCIPIIELQISRVQETSLIKLLEAISSTGYELEELRPVCKSAFNGLEIIISQGRQSYYHFEHNCKYLDAIRKRS
jgi:hypothetical protein